MVSNSSHLFDELHVSLYLILYSIQYRNPGREPFHPSTVLDGDLFDQLSTAVHQTLEYDPKHVARPNAYRGQEVRTANSFQVIREDGRAVSNLAY